MTLGQWLICITGGVIALVVLVIAWVVREGLRHGGGRGPV